MPDGDRSWKKKKKEKERESDYEMRWTQPSDLAVLLCSLTKVWISQHSTATVHPSSSPSSSMSRHQSTNKETERLMAVRARLPSSLSISTNTRRCVSERQLLTTALITSWWWGQALWLTLRTSGSVWPEIGREQHIFTVCEQSLSSLWLVQCSELGLLWL